jgi:hypothetical protein
MDEEIYIERNADPRVVRPANLVPARTVTVTPAASRVGYAPSAYAPVPAMGYPGYPGYAPAPFFGAPPAYATGPAYPWAGQPWGGQLSALFGGVNLGTIGKLALDGWAALKALPAAPVPTGDVATDVANMDTHLGALFKDAQTRAQIAFGGEVLDRFFSRGGYFGW